MTIGFSARRRNQRRLIRQIADSAVFGVQRYRDAPSPQLLDELQTAGRQTMLAVLERIQDWDSRKERRRERLAKLLTGRTDRGLILGRTARGGQDFASLLRLEKHLVLQIGDALAWITLGGDTHRIAPLFASDRAHVPISTGTGLAAVATIAGALNDSGELYALDNDLTRCLGSGDLTVRLASAPASVPLLMEIKGKGRFQEGENIGIQVEAATSDSETDRKTWEIACTVMDRAGIGVGDASAAVRTGPRIVRQQSQLIARSQGIREVAARRFQWLGPSGRTLWGPLDNVLRHAAVRGLTVDQIEPGVVMMAARVDDGAEVRKRAEALIAAAAEHVSDIHTWKWMSSLHLIDNSPLAPLVAPIPLWHVERSARVALLTSDLVYICAVHPDLWTRAFAREGINLEDTRAGWRLTAEGHVSAFSRVEAAKIRYGVAFSGISPREVAAAVRAQWQQPI